MAEVSRRRVTYEQLEQLWEFLNQNRGIATGYNKTAQARAFSKRMWENISQNLNSHGNGAVKDWKGWSKYWNDYKSKIKKLAAAARTSHQQTGGGPSTVTEMTDIEKKFLHILGDDYGSGVSGIRVEPLELEDATEQVVNSSRTLTFVEDVGESESIITIEPGIQVVDYENPQPGPSSRLTPPRLDTPPAAAPTIEPEIQRTPQRSLRRRRQLRREPLLSQEGARRALVQMSEQQLVIEDRNSQTLIALLREITEIKEILRSRSLGHPTDGE